MNNYWLHYGLRPALHFTCLIPAALLLLNLLTQNLGTNPIEKLTHETGEWCLRLLLATLLVTPLIKLCQLNWLILFRRPLGLYAFFYCVLHFLIYLIFDQELSLTYLTEDILDRPYITVGFIAFILLIPLTITSTKKFRRRLGKRWLTLHKLVYLISALGLIHLIWIVRADYREAWIYSSIFLALMLFRIPTKHKKTKGRIRLSE